MLKLMSKINHILTEWVPGEIHSLHWFKEKKVSQNLAYQYFLSGSLDKKGPGIYSRKEEKLHWLGGVRLLQEELKKKIHVSGRTALELHGHTHFAPLAEKPMISLTSYQNERIPKWFNEIDFSCDFNYKTSALFSNDIELSEYKDARGIKIWISSRELAILEYINELDLRYSFETAENYLNGLLGLRSDVLQSLLENCHSFKLKRVFLYLTEKLNYPYFKKLNLKNIDLGKGKRQVVLENSEFNKKYQITIPKDFGVSPF